LEPGWNISSINPDRTATPPACGCAEAPTARPVIGCRGADAGVAWTGQLGNVINRPEALNRTGTQPLLTYSP
jgi:hypothetical protein